MTPFIPFLLGFIAMASLIAGIFFLKFWSITHDLLFLAFAVFFFLDAGDRTVLLFFKHPNQGSPVIYMIRVVGLLLIITAILRKNYIRRS